MTICDILGILITLGILGIGFLLMIMMIIYFISCLEIKRKLFKLRKRKPKEYFDLTKLQSDKEKNNKRSNYIYKRKLKAENNYLNFMISGCPESIKEQVMQQNRKLKEYKYMWWALNRKNETNYKTIDKELEKKIEYNNLGDVETVKRVLS